MQHWINGGETSLANTLLICSRHHRLLHEGEFTIQKDCTGNWYFRNNLGKIIPEGPFFNAPDDEDMCLNESDIPIRENPPRGGLGSFDLRPGEVRFRNTTEQLTPD